MYQALGYLYRSTKRIYIAEQKTQKVALYVSQGWGQPLSSHVVDRSVFTQQGDSGTTSQVNSLYSLLNLRGLGSMEQECRMGRIGLSHLIIMIVLAWSWILCSFQTAAALWFGTDIRQHHDPGAERHNMTFAECLLYVRNHIQDFIICISVHFYSHLLW